MDSFVVPSSSRPTFCFVFNFVVVFAIGQVREHCLSLLMKSLEDNIGSRSHSSYGDSGDGNGCATSLQSSSSSLGADVEQRAVEMEHSLFCSSKTVETYKLSVHKKVRSINNSCALQVLHVVVVRIKES